MLLHGTSLNKIQSLTPHIFKANATLKNCNKFIMNKYYKASQDVVLFKYGQTFTMSKTI
jgi:hypothetical protein